MRKEAEEGVQGRKFQNREGLTGPLRLLTACSVLSQAGFLAPKGVNAHLGTGFVCPGRPLFAYFGLSPSESHSLSSQGHFRPTEGFEAGMSKKRDIGSVSFPRSRHAKP